MLFATVAILFAVFSITLDKRSAILLGNVLSWLVLCASIANCHFDHTDSFQLLFAAMVVAVFLQCSLLICTKVIHPHVAKEMMWLGIFGAGP
jgi:dihydroceramidase